MKAKLIDNKLVVDRDEKDLPALPLTMQQPQNRREYNRQRTSYTLLFRIKGDAEQALEKVLTFSDFDSACVWLNKQ